MPSPLKSPTAIDCGSDPVVGFTAVAVNVPSPLPRRIVKVLLLKFATAKSALPSLLKSPTATKTGLLPVCGLVAVALNVPSPLPRRIVNVLLFGFTTAISGMPSPLKSPDAMDDGYEPVAIDCELCQLRDVTPCPKAAVSSTEFPLLVSRKETAPAGGRDPCPATVAVNV